MKKVGLTVCVLLLVSCFAFSQKQGELRVMFYNTENLFDFENNPITNDDDFLPEGNKHWTPDKYNRKLRNLSKVIIAAGKWSSPDIVGLCEVENRRVLDDLLQKTALSSIPYSVCHYDSPDKRGIDVALLFRSDKLSLVEQKVIPIHIKSIPEFSTRDILMVKLSCLSDTLCVFVNHWPSRVGGELNTEKLRCEVASVLKSVTDSILQCRKAAKVLIVGDMNDEPTDISLSSYLNARTDFLDISPKALFNLTSYKSIGGTHKFRGRWFTFDQIIVSGNLLKSNRLHTSVDAVQVFRPSFVLEMDEKNQGERLFPTYAGPRYRGGYSDHLPVLVDLFITSE
jgi:predicted extracellular nuclease